MKQYTDEELMLMFQQGTSAAFELLFERYRIPVFAFMLRMLGGDREAAEDLYQEIFIKIIKGRDLYEPTARFSTWLYTIARNHCLNFLKSKSYRQAKQTVSLSADKAPSVPAADKSTDIIDVQVQDSLESAIAALPNQYREVFLLRAVEGMSHDEIAVVLDMPPATVRTHFHRARKILRDSMQPVLSKGAE